MLNDAIDRSDLEEADKFAQELQMSQEVTFADYLLCLNLYLKLDQKKFDALLEKVKPVAARNPSDLALLMDWMNNNKQAAEVLKWVDKLPSEITTRPPVAIAVAEAFAHMKNWSRLKRWTRTSSWAEQDYLRLAYQSYAARQARQTVADAESDRLWRSAESATSGRPEREANLARLATRWNLSIEATQLWASVSRNPSTRREALDALYRIYRKSNELRKLYDVLQRLHENSPNEIGITADLARLGLNIDHNTQQAQELAKEAYDRAPENVNCAVTYAFALYGLGRTTEGLEIMRKLPADKLHDPHAAVYFATLLLDENETEMAKEYIEAAQGGSLYTEEKKLFEEAKLKLAPASPTPSPTTSPTPATNKHPRQKPRQRPRRRPRANLYTDRQYRDRPWRHRAGAICAGFESCPHGPREHPEDADKPGVLHPNRRRAERLVDPVATSSFRRAGRALPGECACCQSLRIGPLPLFAT